MEAARHPAVAQKSAADDDRPDDLTASAIASILQMLKLPDGTVKGRRRHAARAYRAGAR